MTDDDVPDNAGRRKPGLERTGKRQGGSEGGLDIQFVIDSLDRFQKLSDADRAAMAALPFELERYPANHLLVREGDRPERCGMLLEGYACRHKMTSDGQRQIVSFHIPGDFLDTQHLELQVADHNVQTITATSMALVSRNSLQQFVEDHPTVRKALWRSALVDASVFREWVLNVGRRDAVARVAHMLCEFAARREAAGLGSPDRFELPMTQEHIADATGLTQVHVNRMLQTLGTMGLIERTRREVQITDWDKIRRVADFDSTYLHIAA